MNQIRYFYSLFIESRSLRTVIRFSLFLILFQIFSIFPTTVFAEEISDQLTTTDESNWKKARNFAIVVGIVILLWGISNVFGTPTTQDNLLINDIPNDNSNKSMPIPVSPVEIQPNNCKYRTNKGCGRSSRSNRKNSSNYG
jgi:hypothetical protein